MQKTYKGAVLAAAVAGMIFSGQALMKSAVAETGKVKCSGGNACKGKTACKTDANACAGQNGCKGKGWVMTETCKECTDQGGKVVKDTK